MFELRTGCPNFDRVSELWQGVRTLWQGVRTLDRVSELRALYPCNEGSEFPHPDKENVNPKILNFFLLRGKWWGSCCGKLVERGTKIGRGIKTCLETNVNILAYQWLISPGICLVNGRSAQLGWLVGWSGGGSEHLSFLWPSPYFIW